MVRIKNRSAMAMMILSVAVFPKTSLAAMDGTSEVKAFTHIGMANNPSTPKGTYHWFNLSGNFIRAYVETDGSVVVLRDVEDGSTGNLPIIDDNNNELTKFVLSFAALAELDDIDRLRLYTGYDDASSAPAPSGNLALDSETTNSGVIGRLKAGLSLHSGHYDDNAMNDTWNETGPSSVTTPTLTLDANCAGNDITDSQNILDGYVFLKYRVFHGCVNPNMVQFIPGQNTLDPVHHSSLVTDQYYSLSVRAPSVPIPGFTGALDVDKTASDDTNVTVGQVITYTYVITNNTADMITDISMAELLLGTGSHNGHGDAPEPDIESGTITEGSDTDNVAGDSYNPVDSNNVWDALAPGDKLTVTATYTVTQEDIEELQ